jgi:hypothetical protein
MPIRQNHTRCLCLECIVVHPQGRFLNSHELRAHHASARARREGHSVNLNTEAGSTQTSTSTAQTSASAEVDVINFLTSQLLALTFVDGDVDVCPDTPLGMLQTNVGHSIPFAVGDRSATSQLPLPAALSAPSSSSVCKLDHRIATALKILDNIDLKIQETSRCITEGNLASWEVTLTRLRRALESVSRRVDSLTPARQQLTRQLEQLHQFCVSHTSGPQSVDEEPVSFNTGAILS